MQATGERAKTLAVVKSNEVNIDKPKIWRYLYFLIGVFGSGKRHPSPATKLCLYATESLDMGRCYRQNEWAVYFTEPGSFSLRF
jgi:hypothetical protein